VVHRASALSQKQPSPRVTIRRLGRIYDPEVAEGSEWMREFAQCPTPHLLDENSVRVFMATRPPRDSEHQYVSYTTYVDLAREDLFRITGASRSPVLSLGDRGMFDEFGVMPSCIVRHRDQFRLYYSGWTRAESVPYMIAVGVALSEDGGRSFHRIGPGPSLGIGPQDPFFVTGPVVQREVDGWEMWYLSCLNWMTHPNTGRLEPIYRIARANSKDGLNWLRGAGDVVPTTSQYECQDIFSPFWAEGRWHAVFAVRDPILGDGRYQFAYASSQDKTNWTRDDGALKYDGDQLDWDSEMRCYPTILELDGKRVMFYCGNQFGRTGFGIAEILISSEKTS
jgi:hypothetical protein